MKPAPFAYHAPRCMDEALATLAEVAPHDGRVLAGGQSLVPAMALRLARPAHLVDINGVKDLEQLAVVAGELQIGACVRHAAFHREQVVAGPLGMLLSHVASHIAHLPIRTRGTFCGSIAHADPAAEWCLVAATLGATMVAASVRAVRTIPAADFFRGALTTALAGDELLAHVRLPVLPDESRFGFAEFSRRCGDFAIAMALATFRLHSGVITDVRIGIGGVEGTPRRIAAAEAVLEGGRPGEAAFRAAAEAVAEAIDPLGDENYPPRYRRDVARAMTFRALERTQEYDEGRRASGSNRRAYFIKGRAVPTISRGAREAPHAGDAAVPVEAKYIGRSVQRLEDLPLVTGRGRFAADIDFPNQLHMRVVRSAYAHAEIMTVDVSRARAAAGVVAVWTAADVSELKPIALREGPDEKLDPYLQPVLAKGRVRYVGEPLAVVFSEDPYLAEDAAELVNVEVRELAPVLDAYPAPVEFAPGRSTEPLVMRKGYGDAESGFRAAHAVIELDLRIGRHSGVPLETRGAIACYDSTGDVVHMYGAAKVPHRTRDGIAHVLGRAPESVHLHEGHVGGGFGVRGEVYPEDVLVCLGALELGRPVKWIEDRYEHLIAANHSREQRHRVRAAVDAAGHLLALDDEFYLDQGAYPRTHGARVLDMTSGMLPGPYHLPAYRATGHYRLTNKTPAATYRAPGRFEGAFVRERVLDAIADRLGLDRVEVRRRNLIPRSAMPYKRELDALGDDVVLDSGDYHGLLDKALGAIGWEALQKDLARRRSQGEMVGAGIAFFVEKTGLGPRDGAQVNVDGEGNVEVVTGSSSLGQGVETVMAQICADALGVHYRRVQVVHGQTDRIARGIGAHASRATVMTGSAVHVAALNARAKAIEAAAAMMDVPAEMLDIADGRVARKDSPDAISIDLAEVARSLARTGHGPGLTAEGWFETPHMNYPYGVHLAVVRVDRDTGAAVVERFLIAYDVGRAINPMLVEGQLAGGFAQGLGGTLYEEFSYDAHGQPLAVTFADYLIPTAREVPPAEVLISEDAPSPLNPLGIKGAGEGGVPGAGAAIAAAIDAAVGIAGAVTQLPVTPVRLKNILDAGHRTT